MNKFMIKFIRFAKSIISFTAIATLLACASANQNRTVRVGTVAGSVDFRIVGSYGQLDNPSRSVDASASVPISGAPVPVDVLLSRAGLDAHVSIDIAEVGKDFTLEIIGTGIQNAEEYSIETKSEKIRVGGTTTLEKARK